MLRRLILLIFDIVITVVVLKSDLAYGESTTHIPDVDVVYEVTTNSCWSSNECLIAANLHFHSGNVLPITVNCSVAENLNDESINSLVRRRYENISSVTLDGCGAALNINTFGFEYIPNCGKITSLNLKNFHFDEIYEIICGSGMALENVCFEHNEFAGLSASSISNLHNLTSLHFINNNLRHLDVEAFNGLKLLREISLVEEKNLRIRNAKLFENLFRLEKLYMSGLAAITSDLLMHLPANLDELTINKAAFDSKVIEVEASPTLQNLTLTNCELTTATIKGHEMITQVNLSSNSLTEFFLENCTHIKIIDLSSNNLTHLEHKQIEQLYHLDFVFLQGNKLKRFSILMFSNSLSHMQAIDVRNNDLEYIDDVAEDIIGNSQLNIFVDGNPWNCLWLVNISFSFPQQYRVFRYEKFISKINVNGLECITYPPDSGLPDVNTNLRSNSSAKFTIVYGGPRESKRNQKAEAFVIVFMLPVGIAFLFVLLYLWINCQKLFHSSYYRSLFMGRSSAERFDIVRAFPLNKGTNSQNQGYEIPMTGCKCAGHENKVCCKFNVTYEETPQQNAAKVYEEIFEYNTSTDNCYCDRISRE